MIEFDLHDLRAAFTACARVADGRRTAVLGNVLLVTTRDSAQLYASDGENHFRCIIECDPESPAKVLLPVSRMLPILSTATDDRISIEDDDRNIVVKCGSAVFHLPKQDPAEFPAMPTLEGECVEVRIARAELSKAIRSVEYATDQDSTRYQLGGVLFETVGCAFHFVATDGRRMANYLHTIAANPKSDIRAIVPLRACKMIAAIDGGDEVTISGGGRWMQVSCGSTVIAATLVEGRYPDWPKVIPSSEGATDIEIPAGKLERLVRQAAITSTDESRGISLRVSDGKIIASSKTADVGSAQVVEAIECSYEVEATLDHKFILEPLRILEPDDVVTLSFLSPDKPVTMRAGAFLYVLMPMSRS
jgi:DNA polymerase-3 subunit beta